MPLSHPAKELPMILSYTCTYAFGYVYFQSTVPIPMLTYAVGLLSYLCLPPSYAFEIPMQLSYICLRATYAFDLALRLPFRMPALLSYLCLQSSYAFEVPMQLSFLCLRATYAFELPMFSSYLCF